LDSPKFVVQLLHKGAKDAHDDYIPGETWEDTVWRPSREGYKSLDEARREFPSERYRVVMVVDEGMESHLG
jgi:hypothetical protein